MNPKRSNRTLVYMLLMIGIIGVVILSNVLFTMVTQKHLRTGTNVKEYKDPDISSSNVLKAKRGTIYDRNGEVIAQDEDTYKLIEMCIRDRPGSIRVVLSSFRWIWMFMILHRYNTLPTTRMRSGRPPTLNSTISMTMF